MSGFFTPVSPIVPAQANSLYNLLMDIENLKKTYAMPVFRLIETLEIFVELATEVKLIRVEIFEAINKDGFFRTRIWLQNIYDLYPTILNLDLGREGERKIYSSENLNVDISFLVAKSPEWMTGISCNCKEEFSNMIQLHVINFFKKME